MDTEADRQRVLVTGGSGYLAGWIIVTLLQRGYRVRATLRSLAREAEVRAAVATEVAADGRLEFAVADLLADAGWDAATDGADLVVHTASPMPVGDYRGTDVIRPAREGTRRVLEAAQRAGVRRVVVTSSGYAAIDTRAAGPVVRMDETVWPDLSAPGVNDYARAKTLAEQDAWAFAAAHPELVLATVLPGFILGPSLSHDIGASMEVIARLLTGQFPAVPRIGFSIVDVRDLAELHVRALTSPAAAGQRFIGSGEFRWLREIAATLRARLGADAAKVPTAVMPDLVFRLLALVSSDVRQMAPNLGRCRLLDAAKADRLLDWRSRAVEETIVDAASSLQRAAVPV